MRQFSIMATFADRKKLSETITEAQHLPSFERVFLRGCRMIMMP